MKKFFLLLISLVAAASSSAQSKAVYLFSYFKNNGENGLHLAYSYDGYTWKTLMNDSSFLKPAVGKDKLMRDPCIIRGADGLFHMVWTSGWTDKGIGYASSKDLINWSAQKNIPVMEHEPNARNSWAPEITYDKKNRQYLIYWATTIRGRFPAGDMTGDDGYNHRIYCTTTRDFKKFSPTRLLYDQGFNVIDASIQGDGDRYIMFLKDETRKPVQKNLRVAFSERADGGFGKPSQPITGKYWAEGPTAIRINGSWIVYFDKYAEHRYGAVSSKDLTTWTDISDKVSFPKGTRHGTVFTVSAKEFNELQKKVAG